MAKAKRLEVELELGGDYVERLQRVGPREGESQIAFAMRIAGLLHGRRELKTRCESAGDVAAALTQLGVKHNNHAATIRKLGFLREELEAIARSGGRIGLPLL